MAPGSQQAVDIDLSRGENRLLLLLLNTAKIEFKQLLQEKFSGNKIGIHIGLSSLKFKLMSLAWRITQPNWTGHGCQLLYLHSKEAEREVKSLGKQNKADADMSSEEVLQEAGTFGLLEN